MHREMHTCEQVISDYAVLLNSGYLMLLFVLKSLASFGANLNVYCSSAGLENMVHVHQNFHMNEHLTDTNLLLFSLLFYIELLMILLSISRRGLVAFLSLWSPV